MKAFYYEAFGGPEIMRVGELAEPAPRKNEALVAVRASSVNPLDFKMRSGALRLFVGSAFPRITGADFAGEVLATGTEAGDLRPGDRVFGYVNAFKRQQGAHAERVAVPAQQMRRIPEGVSFEEAAALPCAGLTAIAGLLAAGPLEGRSVLVNGATGGVGHLAMRIAQARGAHVAARVSEKKAALARQLGASEAFAREAGPLASLGRAFDVIFDAWGHLGFGEASPALAPRGALISPLPSAALALRALASRVFGGKRVLFANLMGREAHWAELLRLVALGLRAHIGATFSLDDAAKAVALVEGGSAQGKVVLLAVPAPLGGA
jgi:NADPH:quinone reductase-like Zn-dependent oxidoreductase